MTTDLVQYLWELSSSSSVSWTGKLDWAHPSPSLTMAELLLLGHSPWSWKCGCWHSSRICPSWNVKSLYTTRKLQEVIHEMVYRTFLDFVKWGGKTLEKLQQMKNTRYTSHLVRPLILFSHLPSKDCSYIRMLVSLFMMTSWTSLKAVTQSPVVSSPDWVILFNISVIQAITDYIDNCSLEWYLRLYNQM